MCATIVLCNVRFSHIFCGYLCIFIIFICKVITKCCKKKKYIYIYIYILIYINIYIYIYIYIYIIFLNIKYEFSTIYSRFSPFFPSSIILNDNDGTVKRGLCKCNEAK